MVHIHDLILAYKPLHREDNVRSDIATRKESTPIQLKTRSYSLNSLSKSSKIFRIELFIDTLVREEQFRNELFIRFRRTQLTLPWFWTDGIFFFLSWWSWRREFGALSFDFRLILTAPTFVSFYYRMDERYVSANHVDDFSGRVHSELLLLLQ